MTVLQGQDSAGCLGILFLMKYGQFFEFLWTRNLEVVKEGKEMIFCLMEAVVKSSVMGLLSDEVVKALEVVVEQGPYYVKNVRDVGLE